MMIDSCIHGTADPIPADIGDYIGQIAAVFAGRECGVEESVVSVSEIGTKATNQAFRSAAAVLHSKIWAGCRTALYFVCESALNINSEFACANEPFDPLQLLTGSPLLTRNRGSLLNWINIWRKSTPAAVIASRANEAATSNGKVVDGTRTTEFIAATRTSVHVPLGATTMAFDSAGQCLSGCN